MLEKTEGTDLLFVVLVDPIKSSGGPLCNYNNVRN